MQQSWLLDEDVLIKGNTKDNIFYPNSKECGFDYQKLTNNDIGKIIFFDLDEAYKKYGELPVIE